jgi:hypothetical protein
VGGGGWWWWVCKSILVFNLCFDQSEQFYPYLQKRLF